LASGPRNFWKRDSSRAAEERKAVPEQFDNVSVVCKANVYFNGGVVSHTVKFASGEKKTLGLIFKGSYNFNTDAPEKMEIVAGTCRVKQKGETEWKTYAGGTYFDVPGKSSFDIAVEDGVAEYICSFLKG
jgi:purine/pyrimidine-nucleoside phosphorylase